MIGARGSGAATACAPSWGEVAEVVSVKARKDSSRLAVTLDKDEHRPAPDLRLPIL